MKIIEIEGSIPPNTKLKIVREPGYSTFWYVYIERKFLPDKRISAQGSTKEKALKDFIETYYGTTYEVPSEKNHPELFI